LEKHGVITPSNRRHVHKKDFASIIAELKLDILSLTQKAEVMRRESARVKAEKIKPVELLLIQQQIQFHSTETQVTGLTDLIDEFQEANRAITLLRSICSNTEKEILEEGKARESMLKETDMILDALDLEESNKHHAPKLVGGKPEMPEMSEIETDERHLNRLRQELTNDARFDAALSADAFIEVGRAAEARADRDSLGIDDLRTEVSELQDKATYSGHQCRVLAKSNRKQRTLLQEIQSREIEVPIPPDFNTKARRLDERIAEKRAQLEKVIQSTLSLTEEVLRLHSFPRIQSPSQGYLEEESTTSETSESLNDLDLINADIERGLLGQRELARRELSETEERYRNLKNYLSAKQSNLIEELRVLKSKSGKNGHELGFGGGNVVSFMDEGDSGIMVMMSRIEDSLQALKSDLL
jgi:hypothetical protein